LARIWETPRRFSSRRTRKHRARAYLSFFSALGSVTVVAASRARCHRAMSPRSTAAFRYQIRARGRANPRSCRKNRSATVKFWRGREKEAKSKLRGGGEGALEVVPHDQAPGEPTVGSEWDGPHGPTANTGPTAAEGRTENSLQDEAQWRYSQRFSRPPSPGNAAI